MRHLGIIAVFCHLLASSSVPASAQDQRLTAKVGNYTAYFTEDERLRHHRYEGWLKQEFSLGFRFKTIFEGRAWWESTMMGNRNAARRDLPQPVRDEEVFEAQARNAYVDYLGDHFQLRIGRQLIDWSESMAPGLVNTITALDLRTGLSGEMGDNIIPVDAIDVTHDLPFGIGRLEWLLIPRGVHHQLPRYDNGYGYYAFLQKQMGDRVLRIRDEEIPKSEDEIEAGLRWKHNIAATDITLFGFRGHQRDPAYGLEAGLSTVDLKRSYPRVNTFGAALVRSFDAFVCRLNYVIEPKRHPADPELLSYPAGSIGRDVYDRKNRIGLGVDYLFSKHLKFYSDHYFIRRDTVVPEDPTPEEKNISGYEDHYAGLLRVTNETLEDVLVQIDSVLLSPKKGHMIEPSLNYSFADYYVLGIGGRFIESEHDDSAFATLEETDLYFVKLEATTDVGRLVAD